MELEKQKDQIKDIQDYDSSSSANEYYVNNTNNTFQCQCNHPNNNTNSFHKQMMSADYNQKKHYYNKNSKSDIFELNPSHSSQFNDRKLFLNKVQQKFQRNNNSNTQSSIKAMVKSPISVKNRFNNDSILNRVKNDRESKDKDRDKSYFKTVISGISNSSNTSKQNYKLDLKDKRNKKSQSSLKKKNDTKTFSWFFVY